MTVKTIGALSQAQKWWQPEHGFFGKFYMEGDDSLEGYLQEKNQKLEERTHIEVMGVCNLLSLQGGESILDLPCGYGRHSLALAKEGFNVTGCDLNPTHLDKAQKSSQASGLDVNWVLGNMLDVKFSKKFDAIINMFYSFGFFEDDNDNLRTLENFYAALKSKGKLLFHTDVNVPRIISGKYKIYEERLLTSGAKLIIKDEYNYETKRIEGSWVIEKDGKRIERDYSVRVYTLEEFMALCKQVGFQSIHAYSDWNKIKYNSQSEDMMIVAEK